MLFLKGYRVQQYIHNHGISWLIHNYFVLPTRKHDAFISCEAVGDGQWTNRSNNNLNYVFQCRLQYRYFFEVKNRFIYIDEHRYIDNLHIQLSNSYMQKGCTNMKLKAPTCTPYSQPNKNGIQMCCINWIYLTIVQLGVTCWCNSEAAYYVAPFWIDWCVSYDISSDVCNNIRQFYKGS